MNEFDYIKRATHLTNLINRENVHVKYSNISDEAFYHIVDGNVGMMLSMPEDVTDEQALRSDKQIQEMTGLNETSLQS